MLSSVPLRALVLCSLFIGQAMAGDPAPATNHAAHATAAPPLTMEAPPVGAKVMFVAPQADMTVPQQLKVIFGVQGMTVQPAGEIKPGTGHHHLIIDAPAIPAGEIVPKDAQHIHFGDGATETMVTLTPGEHTLTLQFADGIHRSYGPQMSATIKVKVQ